MQKLPLPHKKVVFVCVNERKPGDRVSCARQGSCELHEKLKKMVKKMGLREQIRVSKSGCMDMCEEGPNIMVFPDNVWYSHVKEKDLPEILAAITGTPVAELKPE